MGDDGGRGMRDGGWGMGEEDGGTASEVEERGRGIRLRDGGGGGSESQDLSKNLNVLICSNLVSATFFSCSYIFCLTLRTSALVKSLRKIDERTTDSSFW